jgi:hypothetical protein
MRALNLLISLLLSTAALADSADLGIVAVSQNQLQSTIAIVNYGPDVARDMVLTIDYPEALTLRILGADAVRCDYAVRPVRCTMGELAVFPPPTYAGAEFTAPIADATYTATYSISSSTPDPNPANNSVSNSWVTKAEADLLALVFANDVRTNPGEGATFRVLACNQVRDNVTPRNVRLDLAVSGGVIQDILAPPSFACTFDGAAATCTAAALTEACSDQIHVIALASDDRSGGAVRLAAHVTSDAPDRSPANDRAEGAVAVYRLIAVTSAADAGPGSLREAIGDANAHCSPGPCRIIFEIPAPVPAEGWFTITPVSPLPPILADRVAIEGSWQTHFTGDTNLKGPEIAIDGRLEGFGGLQMHARCESVVEGLAIGNFRHVPGVTWSSHGGGCDSPFGDARLVCNNHLGVDPTGLVAWPNLRGIAADEASGLVQANRISHNLRSGFWAWRGSLNLWGNRIEDNGASGIFLGPEVSSVEVFQNTIANHPEMGVAVARGAQLVDIRENAMRNNGGLGIDWGLDGVSPVDSGDAAGASNAPVLLSAVYNALTQQTFVTLTLHSAPLGPYGNGGSIDFYENAAPDGDGEHWLGSVIHPETNTTITVPIRGDQRGKWINATWTRVHFIASQPPKEAIESNSLFGGQTMTSELSNALFVVP